MKAFAVALTSDAEADLGDIIDFIDQREGAVRADHVLSQFERIIARLETLPDRYPVVRELRELGIVDFREAHFKPYRVIFRLNGNSVFIYLVCDGRRDMLTLLQTRLLTPRR